MDRLTVGRVASVAGGDGFRGSGASAGIAEFCCWAVSFLLGECWQLILPRWLASHQAVPQGPLSLTEGPLMGRKQGNVWGHDADRRFPWRLLNLIQSRIRSKVGFLLPFYHFIYVIRGLKKVVELTMEAIVVTQVLCCCDVEYQCD